MSMFDYIQYKGKTYQTKDTLMQILAEYEIRGSELWYNNVEYEWVESDDDLFGGHLEPISSVWERVDNFEGSIRFYDENTEYLALFWEGRMLKIKEIGD